MNIDFAKCGGLVPAIIQDSDTRQVLMLGYMNQEALDKTLSSGLVTFFSRTRQTLWTKGETSGNLLRASTALFHGKRNSEGQYTFCGIAYAQYAKFDFDYTKSLRLDQNSPNFMDQG